MRKTTVFILIFYSLVALFFIRGIIFSSGTVLGGDWSLPFTPFQARRYAESGFYTWTNRTFFGDQQFFLNSLPFQVLIWLLARLKLIGESYIKALLVFAFVFPALTMFFLCQFLGCKRRVSVFGGLLYITTPFFFNYAAMGWLFVLFSMGILPLFLIFFIKSVKEAKLSFSILAGLLYFLAMVQSQSLIWYPLVCFSFAPFFIKDKKGFFTYLRSLFVMFLVFLSINAFWMIPLLLSGNSGVLSTKLGLSSASLGTWARLSNLNILRAWGSLYNYQYETSYPKILIPLSFLLPLLAYSSLFFLKKKRAVYSLVLLSFVPITLFRLGPDFVTSLPFSDLFRDVARFSVVSSFSYVILATILLNFFLQQKQKKVRITGIVFCILLIINAYPFWAGELFGQQKYDYDIRLRTYNFSPANLVLESSLNQEKGDVKVLYLPVGGTLSLTDDKRFYGAFKEIRDISASFSPKRGAIGITDKSAGNATDLIQELNQSINNQQFGDLDNLLDLMGVKYVIIRKNASYPSGVSGKEISTLLNRDSGVVLREERDKVSVFENKNFLPHFYIPQNLVYSNGNVANLLDIVNFESANTRSGIYLKNSTLENSEIIDRADQVFIKAVVKSTTNQNYFEQKENLENFKDAVAFPYVRHHPESFEWKLAQLKEKYQEWRLRKNSEKLIDKKLFYAGKRIVEFKKFCTNSVNKELVTQIVASYKIKMEEVVEEIRKLEASTLSKDKQLSNLLTLKLRASLKKHKQQAEEAGHSQSWQRVFQELAEKNKPPENKLNLENLEYGFEISRGGLYEVYIKEKEELGNLEIRESSTGQEKNFRNWQIGINQGKVDQEILLPGKDTWTSLGKIDFQRGQHQLIFNLPEQKNLVANDWQKLKEARTNGAVVEFSPQGFFPNAQNLVFQKINNWQSDSFYYLSFDYRVENGTLGVGVSEEKVFYQEEKSLVKTKNIFEKNIAEKSAGQSRDWQKFETLIKSDLNVLGAKIYFYSLADPSEIADVKFKNLKIYRIIEPEIVLRKESVKEAKNKEVPGITFIRINPTKYKIKVTGAKNPYTLIFSESFDKRWKLYFQNQSKIADSKLQKLTNLFLKNKGFGKEIVSYFNGDVKEGTHRMTFLEPATFETWMVEPIAENNHLLVNGYANSWHITPEDTDGLENYELVVEFWPQKLFYVGFFISATVLVGSLGYLAYALTKRRVF